MWPMSGDTEMRDFATGLLERAGQWWGDYGDATVLGMNRLGWDSYQFGDATKAVMAWLGWGGSHLGDVATGLVNEMGLEMLEGYVQRAAARASLAEADARTVVPNR